MSDTLPWRCDMCDAPAMAVAPGREETRELFLLDDGAPMRCLCLKHWMARYVLLPKREVA